jgi:hypothetical protein
MVAEFVGHDRGSLKRLKVTLIEAAAGREHLPTILPRDPDPAHGPWRSWEATDFDLGSS